MEEIILCIPNLSKEPLFQHFFPLQIDSEGELEKKKEKERKRRTALCAPQKTIGFQGSKGQKILILLDITLAGVRGNCPSLVAWLWKRTRWGKAAGPGSP